MAHHDFQYCTGPVRSAPLPVLFVLSKFADWALGADESPEDLLNKVIKEYTSEKSE